MNSLLAGFGLGGAPTPSLSLATPVSSGASGESGGISSPFNASGSISLGGSNSSALTYAMIAVIVIVALVVIFK
jgi:hypothetical protein